MTIGTTLRRFGPLAVALLVSAGGCGPAATTAPQVVSASPEQDLLRQYLFQGDQYRDSGLPEKAVEQYEKALALDDDNVEVYPRLGYALVKSGNFERAVKIYERYAELEPQNCAARASVGFAFLSQGLVDQAVRAYEKALNVCPQDPNAYTNLGIAYEQANYPLEAIEAFRRSLELNPNDLLGYEKLGKLYYDRKLYPESAAMYEAVLARPDHGKDETWLAWAHGRLAFIYKWADACGKAIPHWQAVQASAAADKDAKTRAVRGLAGCYEETGRPADAIEAYRQLIADVPDQPSYFYRLGDLLNDAGRHEEAIEIAKKGTEIDAGCPAHAYCVIGRAYEKVGGAANYKRAEREFRKAVTCGDARFTEYARKQIERQQQLIKAEDAKQRRDDAGY
jgi:tetratricopeptide (TPR) repeat protein